MKIYLDLVFIVNFGINFIFIYVIQFIFWERFSLSKAILSSTIATLLLISFLFNKIIFLIFKISGGIILVLIGTGLKKLALKTSLFYLLELSLTGLVASYKITGMYLIIGIIIIIVLIIIQDLKKESIFLSRYQYNVSVTFLGKQLSLVGFLDTGNLLIIDNMPVIFINQKHFQKALKPYKTVSIKTVNDKKEITCYSPELFFLFIGKRKVDKKVLIAFADLGNDFDCLLNYHLFL